MTLDDRSLREHLDRRAESGVQDPDALAEAVMARVATVSTGPWWRRLRVGAPSLGIAAAAIVVIVVALAVLPPGIVPGPGASPTAPATVDGYPIDRALTVTELDAVLGSDPAAHAGEIVIAYVTLETRDILCYGIECPRYLAVLDGRTIAVYDPGEAAQELPGPSAFRIRSDGRLDLLGHVRAGPDGLAWTLPQLTAELDNLRGPGVDPVPFLYLVDAWRAVSTNAYRCLATIAQSDPDFGCGSGVAWLVPDEASLPSDFNSAPAGSLRVPNVTGLPSRSNPLQQHGYWLVDPFVRQDGATCFLCPPAGAADLVGHVLTLDEMASPSTTAAPPVAGYPTDRALTAPEVAELVARFTGDGRHVVIVVEAEMLPIDPLPECPGDYGCPTWEMPVPGSEAIAIWTTAGFAPNPDGPDAFTVVSESGGTYGQGLNYVGPVMAGPDGIAWTLPQLLRGLPSARPDGVFPYVYVVEAERVATPNPAACPSVTPEPEPTFDCRADLAWLVPMGTPAIDVVNGPETGIRVPGATYMLDSFARRQSGIWLIDPVPTPPVCVACPAAGAAAMIGRVPSLDELAFTP